VPQPSNLVAGFGSLWARSGSSLWKISAVGHVVDRISNVFSAKPSAVGAQNLAVGSGSVWTVEPRTALRIDPSTGHVTRIATPRGCDQIAAGNGAMFLGCRDSRLIRIDPDTNRTSVVTTVGVSPIGIGYAQGSVWWINASEAGDVSRIDPSTGSVRTVNAPYAKFVVPTAGRVWFLDANALAFSIDPSVGHATAAVKKARVALGATSSDGSVLINDGDLVAFNASTGVVSRRTHAAGIQSAEAVAGIAALGRAIWLVDPKGQRIMAVDG
jgi:streptogramin lyase